MKILIYIIFFGSIMMAQTVGQKNQVSKKIIPITIPSDECLDLDYSYPFNPRFILTLDLSKKTKVKISIYDKNEIFIRDIADQILPAGHNSIFWDRKDYTGMLVNRDVYFHICRQK